MTIKNISKTLEQLAIEHGSRHNDSFLFDLTQLNALVQNAVSIVKGDVVTDVVICPVCDGSGYQPGDNKYYCGNCKGSGRVECKPLHSINMSSLILK